MRHLGAYETLNSPRESYSTATLADTDVWSPPSKYDQDIVMALLSSGVMTSSISIAPSLSFLVMGVRISPLRAPLKVARFSSCRKIEQTCSHLRITQSVPRRETPW